MILEVSEEIKKQGFQVFVANSGEYGFYTDGKKVISFQIEFGSIAFSGNYKTDNPRSTGNGWRICDSIPASLTDTLNSMPPQWAVGNSRWTFTTLKQHLDTYQKSSRYTEI